MTRKFVFGFLLMMLVTACGSSGELRIRDAWARPAAAGENGAVYFVVDNGTGADDRLLSVDSDVASPVEVHMSILMDNGVMSMQMQESVPVPAGDRVEFKPGGLHIMMVLLNRALQVGDTITLSLMFEKAGSIQIDVPVKEY